MDKALLLCFIAKNSTNPTWHTEVTEKFKGILATDRIREIPCLESAPKENLLDGQLVVFKGMIQDMFDPEYFFDSYEGETSTGEKVMKTGRFRDTIDVSC